MLVQRRLGDGHADRKVDSFEDETNDIETHFNDNDFNIDTDHELDFKDMDQKDLEFEDEDGAEAVGAKVLFGLLV